MKIAITIVIALCFQNVIVSQINYDLPQDYVRNQVFFTNQLTNGESYEGSPYLDEKFSPGYIFQNDNKYVARLRLNMYSDAIELKIDDNINEILKDENTTIEIGGKTFVTQELNGDLKYFEQVTTGKINLLVHYSSTFREAKEAQSTYSTDKPASFSKNMDYYALENGSLKEVKLKKNTVLELCADREKEIKNYAKSQKLNLNKEEDAIQAIKFYNAH